MTLDNGPTIYTVVLEFSNDYPSLSSDDAGGHPLNWGWASLIEESDACVLIVNERPNPKWIVPSRDGKETP